MTIIQDQLNGKRMMMKILKKISMMPITMSLMVLMDDEEADAVYEAIDERMDEKRREYREKKEGRN